MPARYSSRSLSLTTEDYPHHHYARGTREALIHHGITRDGPFPGDPGEKKTICNTTDPQGRPIFMRRASKTNTQLDKADHLKREGLPKRELELLVSVLYLEANGPENRGGVEPDLLHEFPPFDPSMAMIPPAIVARAVALFDGLGLTGEQAHAMFLDVATRHRNKLMPVSPVEAWDAITQTSGFRSLP